MIEEIIGDNLEDNCDRLLILIFNCLYFECDIQKSWSVTSRKMVYNSEKNQREFVYFLEISNCCHHLPKLSFECRLKIKSKRT